MLCAKKTAPKFVSCPVSVDLNQWHDSQVLLLFYLLYKFESLNYKILQKFFWKSLFLMIDKYSILGYSTWLHYPQASSAGVAKPRPSN